MLSSTTESRTGLRRHASLLFLLAAGGFTSALNVTLLSPLIVQIADEFGVSEAAAGQLATLTAACAGLTGIVVAPWMDRYSRRFWFRLECSMLAVGTIISAIAPEFGWMFLGRILCGLGGAVIGANCLATCGDLFPDTGERNRAVGLVNSAFTLGAVFGLPIVAMTADLTSWRVAIALPAPLAIAVLIGTRRIPATVRRLDRRLDLDRLARGLRPGRPVTGDSLAAGVGNVAAGRLVRLVDLLRRVHP